MPIIPRKKKYTDKQILQAITNSKGLLYIAAKSLGCNACTLHDRANKNPVIREAIDNERGEILDWSEAKLVSAVKNGEAWAVCFILKTLGKSRGYIERQEVLADIRVDFSGNIQELTDDELTIIARGGKLSARTK